MDDQEENKAGYKKKLKNQLTINQEQKTKQYRGLNSVLTEKNNAPASHDAKLHAQPG